MCYNSCGSVGGARMYNLGYYNFGESFRKIRKSKKMSINELSERINKTPSTIYKYEANTIIPDFEVILSICNALEIDLNDLVNKREVNEEVQRSNNPFSVDKLYMYYIDSTDKLYEMLLTIKSENGIMKVYFSVPKLNKIFLVGSIESNSEVAFILMKNYHVENDHFEKVMIYINMKYASDDIKMGIICGEKDDSFDPVVKKVCISKNKLNEKEKNEMRKRLSLTDEELNQIKNDGFWYPDISNKKSY